MLTGIDFCISTHCKLIAAVEIKIFCNNHCQFLRNLISPFFNTVVIDNVYFNHFKINLNLYILESSSVLYACHYTW